MAVAALMCVGLTAWVWWATPMNPFGFLARSLVIWPFITGANYLVYRLLRVVLLSFVLARIEQARVRRGPPKLGELIETAVWLLILPVGMGLLWGITDGPLWGMAIGAAMCVGELVLRLLTHQLEDFLLGLVESGHGSFALALARRDNQRLEQKARQASSLPRGQVWP